MPETPTTTVTPSSLTPKNVVAPKTPDTPAAPPAQSAPDPLAERESKISQREQAMEKREKTWKAETKKWAVEKDGLGAKLSRLNELEKREQLAKLNPPEYLKSIYGDKWFETLSAVQINGVPTADLLASELQKVREEFRNELKSREEKLQKDATAAEQREYQEAQAIAATRAAEFYKANDKDYPVFKRLGDAQRVGQMLASRIEQHFASTGKLLTEKDAADGLDADMYGLLEEAVQHEKYKSKLQSKLVPANVTPSSGSTQGVQSSTRRTLSNHLTASTPGRAPPRSDAERLERSMAAFNAARAKSQS